MYNLKRLMSPSVLSLFGDNSPKKQDALEGADGEFKCNMCKDTQLLCEGGTAELCYCVRPVKINAYPEMNRVTDIMPQDGIRVIAALDSFIVGDCVIATGNVMSEKMACPEYVQQVSIKTWRYTQSLELVPEHLTPNQWTPLPLVQPLAK